MAKKLLTDKGVTAAKAAEKAYVISDVRSTNLNLIVHPSGSKVYVWRGRVRDKTVSITLGNTQVHGLADARDWADGLTAERDRGVDIRAAKAATKVAAVAAEIDAGRTVTALFEAYMTDEGDKLADAKGRRAHFVNDVLPTIGDRPIASITLDDIDAIIARKGELYKIGANRLHAAISRFLKWCTTTSAGRVASGLTPAGNVYRGMPKPYPNAEKTKDRFLSKDEIGFLQKALDAEPVRWRAFYRLLLLTGCRRAEIAGLDRAEISFRPGSEYITLPGGRTKNGYKHVVPLSEPAIVELRAALALAGNSRFVFPSRKKDAEGNAVAAMSGFSRTHPRVKSRMNEIAEKAGASPVQTWTVHDLRRTLASTLPDFGVEAVVIEALLNHVSGVLKGPAGTYNHNSYLDQRRAALHAWGKHVTELAANNHLPQSD